MKKTLTISFLLMILYSCSRNAYLFTSFHEPADQGLRMLYSYDGIHWKDTDTVLLRPAVGTQKVMRDPSMVKGPDGVFHLVWTSSWRGDKGFGYASSKDLLHWSEQQSVPVMSSEPGTVNVWAPELFYDEKSREYIIIWASCIPGRFKRGLEEDSNNHRMYFTRTGDFRTFSPAKLFLDPGFSVIDAVIVKAGKGEYVLVLKDNTRLERDLKVAFSQSPLGPWTNISAPFTDHFTEGPAVVKLKDRWWIYYDAYREKKFGASSTRDFVHFDTATREVSVPEAHKHGTIVTVKRAFLKQFLKKLNRK